jgi:excisionase family DNA binding protein
MLTSTTRRLTYRPHEVARLTGLTEPTVRGLIARGALPRVKLGRRVLVQAEDLEAYLAGIGRPPASAL